MSGAAGRVLLEEFQLGDWRVRPRDGVLQRGEQVRRLGPKPMDVLGVLAASAGRTVSPEEIFEAVWGDRIIEPGGLARIVSELRKALGDDAREPAYIQTVPKRGYRLVASVESAPGDAQSAPGDVEILPEMPARPRRAQIVAMRGALSALLMAAAVWAVSGGLETPVPRIGMLPPTVLDSSPASREAAETLAQMLPLALSRTAGSEAEIVPLEGLPSAGAMLAWARLSGRHRVDYVVEARVENENHFVGVSLSLRRLEGGGIVWSQIVPIQLEDLSALTQNAARDISGALDLEPPRPGTLLAADGAMPRPAGAEYLRGIRLTQGTLDFDDLVAGIEELHDVIRQKPDSAPAHAALARAYLRLRTYPGDRLARLRSADNAARKALTLDPESVGARLALAEIDFFHRFDLISAEARLREALEREPFNADVLFLLAFVHSAAGEHDEAIRLATRGRRSVPATHETTWHLVNAHSLARRYDQAAAIARAGLRELRPGRDQKLAYALFSNLALAGREAEALEVVNTLLLTRGDRAVSTLAEFWLRYRRVLEHRQAMGFEVLTEIAMLNLKLGEQQLALEQAITACETRSGKRVPFLRVDPRIDELRTMPGFSRLKACLETPATEARIARLMRPFGSTDEVRLASE